MKREDVNDFSEMDDSFLQGLKKNPFSVPDDYFSELAQNTLSITKIIDLKDAESFTVSEGYFTNLENQILSQVNLSSNDNDFSVPPAYFEKLSQDILSKAEQQQTKKPKTQILKLSFVKYAAAAIILLATTLGIYTYNTGYFSQDAVISNK